MRTTGFDVSPAMGVRFRDYLLENVYLRTTQAQRFEIMALWLGEGALNDQAEAERRTHEAVFLVRNASGELAGLSTVGLVRIKDGRVFYAYRMFLRKRDRVPYLMVEVIKATREFLLTFPHPGLQPAGIIHINENPKLMRPGVRKTFERHGYRCWGTTPEAEEVWAIEFCAQTRSLTPPAQWREALKQFMRSLGRGQNRNLEFTHISGVSKPTQTTPI